MEYQYGLNIGYKTEMYEYGTEMSVKNRKFNKKFFDERPELLTEEIKNANATK